MRRESQSNSIRSWALVVVMGALGNLLGLATIGLIPIPGLTGLAIDLSNIPVAFLAVFLGKRYGALTGAIAGIGPAIMFGYITGNAGLLSIIFVPLGKVFTGFTVGAVAEIIASRRKLAGRADILASVLIGFIPEALLVIVYFETLVPVFVPGGAYWAPALAIPVFIKGWGEMVLIGLFTAALAANRSFTTFFTRYFPTNTLLVSVPKAAVTTS